MYQTAKRPLRFSLTRLELAALIGVLCSCLLTTFAQFGQECIQLRTDVVRLHILANSDTDADQAVKLAVRDRILLEFGPLFGKAQTQQDAKQTVQASLGKIEQTATQVLAEHGIDLPVHAQICNMYFSTRSYDNLSLPAGPYDAVRITIGAGAGQNWWCVMYPPICVPAAGVGESPAELEIRELNDVPLFIPKLAIVELIETAVDTLRPKPQPITYDMSGSRETDI